MDNFISSANTNDDWLNEVLVEVNLQSFHSKLTNDLQLNKLSHFDYVSEEDLIQLGLSRPAAKRLLAAVKKRKSFVNALKNRIVCKLLPIGGSSSSANSTPSANKIKFDSSQSTSHDFSSNDVGTNNHSSEFGLLKCLINSQDIQVKEEIGNGAHGFVKKGEWTTPTGRVVEVALKILKKDVMSEPGASFNEFVKEISVMHQLNHPNIIKLYGVVLSSPMMMVTELAPFGNLRDRLRKENGHTPISQLINFGVQIASGMAYLESRRFVHRDLAARNIFITHGKKILIGDLGLMRAIPTQDNHYVMSERTKIPYPWCAPESLKLKQFNSSSDVYMFGVTLWEMFSFGREPWAGLTLNEILEKISSQDKRLPCPEACPTMVYQTVLQCWSTEPSLRPNFATLYQYLSTSYPLEVRSTQHVSELSKEHNDGTTANEEFGVYSALQLSCQGLNDGKMNRKVLSCQVNDRILVVDGQPEKYWWKGQNQRTFDIGWFPLNSTRWLAPKKGANFISKPLKNSFVHTGHGGSAGRWGDPRFIDRMYLKSPLVPEDLNSVKAIKMNPSQAECERRLRSDQNTVGNLFFKSKTRSRLSKLFGINDSPGHSILNHTYHKFINEQPKLSSGQVHQIRSEAFRNSLSRSQSDELKAKHIPSCPSTTGPIKDEAPLIDLSEEANGSLMALQNEFVSHNKLPGTGQQQEKSLLDIDTPFPLMDQDQNLFNENIFSANQRRASDTRLDQIDENYHLSWAGSWNTGTFYTSNSNIYSAYYCPQDAANNPNNSHSKENPSTRYYSTVAGNDE